MKRLIALIAAVFVLGAAMPGDTAQFVPAGGVQGISASGTAASSWQIDNDNSGPTLSNSSGSLLLGVDGLLYQAVNDGNPFIRLGATAAESGALTAVYDSGAQTLDYLEISTATADAGADEGRIIFDVDGTDILTVDDGGLEITGNITLNSRGTITDNGTTFTILPATGDYLMVGDAGTQSNGLSDNDDLFVSGKGEFNGTLYADGILQINNAIQFTASPNAGGIIKPYGDDGLHFGLGIDTYQNNNFILTSSLNIDKDHDHETDSGVPTILIHSLTNPDTDNTEFGTYQWNNASIGGDNGSYFGLKSMTEEVTIPVGSGFDPVVETSGNLAPANSIIMGIAARITDAPGGGANTLDIGVTGGAGNELMDDMGTALNTTSTTPATNIGWNPTGNASATTLTLTTDADVTGDEMKVRVVVYYMQFTAPTK